MPQAVTGPSAAGKANSTTVWGRLSQTFLRPPAPRSGSTAGGHDFARMTDEEKRAHIVRIDATERRVGIGASILGVALAIYANVPYMLSKTAVPTTVKPKGTSCGSTLLNGVPLKYVAATKTCNGVYPPSHYVLPLIVSLVLALAIYVTVRVRRRAPLAFTMVMTGLAFGSIIVLLPYGVAAAWIMLRAWRVQKYGSPTARVAVTGWVPPAARGTMRRARSTGPRSSRGKGPQATATANRKPPEPNKRYTPKSPPKKKVPPPAK